MKKIAVIFLLFSQLFASIANSSTVQYAQNIDINLVINNIISASTHPYVKNRVFLSYKITLDELYFLSPQHLLWVEAQIADNEKIDSVLQLISHADKSGLNPEDYDLTYLQQQWKFLLSKKEVSDSEKALFDIAISLNLIHFLSDLRFGRINPKTLELNYNTTQNSLVFIPLILKALQDDDILQLTSWAEPYNKTYHQLKAELINYQKKEQGQAIKEIKYVASIRPNEMSPQLLEIRQQLDLLDDANEFNTASYFYDQELVDVIKKVQFQHGLKEDGIIGKNTLKALNTPVYEYIKKIKLALERFRWLPKQQEDSLIMVNIPAFKLTAYHSDREGMANSQLLEMKVIVGKSKENKSPVFTANMYYLEFSPYWNIPKSILVDEILPKLQENPLYLEQHNMELVAGFHNNEEALPYEEDSFEKLLSGEVRLRQRPGKGNALGKVKFIFPNNYNVYLHDTPSRHLFRKSKRDLSHGCIRVEKPTELARFLLQTKRGWNKKEILSAMHLSKPKKVQLRKSVPVIIYYSTASIVQGEVVFYNDIYNYDNRLSQVLMSDSILQLPAITMGENSVAVISSSQD